MQPTLLSTPANWRDAWSKNWTRPDLQRVRVAVAYCSRHGADEIIKLWRSCGVPVEFLVGLNDGVTDFDAREKLWQWGQNAEIEVRGTFKKSGRFHPKIYVFERAEEIRVMIGSVNLTHNAFHQNSEAAIELVLHRDETLWHDLQKQLDEWWRKSASLARPTIEERLIKLMNDGVLVDVEVQTASLLVYFKRDVFEVGDNKYAQDGAVTIQRINSSNLRLVSNARYEAITKTGKRLHEKLNRIAISTNVGWFVPRSAWADWKRFLEKAKKELAQQIEPFESAQGRAQEREQWISDLRKQIQKTWLKFHQKEADQQRVEEIVALATQAFDEKAASFPQTVRLVVIHAPHPFPAMLKYAGAANDTEQTHGLFGKTKDFVLAPSQMMEADLYRLTMESRNTELRAWMQALTLVSREAYIEGIKDVLKTQSRANYRERLCARLHQLSSLEDFWSQGALKILTSSNSTTDDYKVLRAEAVEQSRQIQKWQDPAVPIEQVLSEFASFVGWRE